jgi:Leucine-rich repeat (LRR) protein
MKKFRKSVYATSLFAVTLLSACLGVASNRVELMGDLVVCEMKNGVANEFSLDLLTNPAKENFRAVDAYEGFALLNHVGYRGFAKDFYQFMASSTQPADSYKMYNVWQEAAFGFPDADVSAIRSQIPQSCKNPRAKHLVVRQFTSRANLIQFDAKSIDRLRSQSPLDLNFILVHEWLSQNFDDADLVRTLNLLWHHPHVMKDVELTRKFQELISRGLELAPPTGTVCERSSIVQAAIKFSTEKSCQDTTNSDLARIRELEVKDFDRTIILPEDVNLRRFDFAKLSALQRLNFSEARFFSDEIPEGIFTGTPNLKELIIRNAIKLHLKVPIFRGLSELELLDMHGSFIENIEPGVFVGRFRNTPAAQNILDLGGNQSFEEIKPGAFLGLENLKMLLLNDWSMRVSIDAKAFLHLKSLVSLDLERGELIQFSTPLTSRELPHIQKLILSRQQTPLDKVGSLPSLRELDLSNSQTNIEVSNLRRFPHLKFLDLTNSQTRMPEGVGTLTSLAELDELTLMSTEFTNGDRNFHWEVLKSGLPPNLKTLKICRRDSTAAATFSDVREAKSKNPQLKVVSKDHCEGEWIYDSLFAHASLLFSPSSPLTVPPAAGTEASSAMVATYFFVVKQLTPSSTVTTHWIMFLITAATVNFRS